MRRLFRWCFHGLCLLSLPACAGTAWLWWRAERAGAVEAVVDVAALRNELELSSRPDGLRLRAVGHWPGWAGAWAGEGLDAPCCIAAGPAPPWEGRATRLHGLVFRRGRMRVYLRPDGRPKRRTGREFLSPAWLAACAPPPARSPVRWSGPLPWWELGPVPHALALALLASPPLLWLGLRSRRLYALHRRRRHRRLGVCLRCGYDLTGNTSGRCSECGEKIEPVTAELRVTA